ncbi:MAG: hypothetical protein R3C53_11090 [Pirellulaceae bacterium]
MGDAIRDKNVRIFAAEGGIYAVSAGVHALLPIRSTQLLNSPLGESMSPSHAFYLGFEMAKASPQLRSVSSTNRMNRWIGVF